MPVTLLQLLKTVVERGGRELHLAVNSPAQIRLENDLQPLDMMPVTRSELETLLVAGLPEGVGLKIQHSATFSYTWAVSGLSRFALSSIHDVSGIPRVVIRVVAYEILGFKEIGIPEHLTLRQPGLYIIGGAARSGRTSVAAAVLDRHNRECHDNIVVIADGSHPSHTQEFARHAR